MANGLNDFQSRFSALEEERRRATQRLTQASSAKPTTGLLREGQGLTELFTDPSEAQRSGLLSAGLSLLAADPTASLSQRIAGALGSGLGALQEAREGDVSRELASASAGVESAKLEQEAFRSEFGIFGKGKAVTVTDGTTEFTATENQQGQLVRDGQVLPENFKKVSGKGVDIDIDLGNKKNTGLQDIFLKKLDTLTDRQISADKTLVNIRQARAQASNLTEADFGTGADARLGLAKVALFLSQSTGIDFDEEALNKRISGSEGLQSLTQEFIQPFFNETKGSISDREVEMFIGAVPRLVQSKAGFDSLLGFMEAVQERNILKGEFFETWAVSADSPTFSRANRVWSQYTADNDLFRQVEDGGLALNEGAVESDLWRDYVASQGRPSYQLEGESITMSEIKQTAIDEGSTIDEIVELFKNRGMELSGQSIR